MYLSRFVTLIFIAHDKIAGQNIHRARHSVPVELDAQVERMVDGNLKVLQG